MRLRLRMAGLLCCTYTEGTGGHFGRQLQRLLQEDGLNCVQKEGGSLRMIAAYQVPASCASSCHAAPSHTQFSHVSKLPT